MKKTAAKRQALPHWDLSDLYVASDSPKIKADQERAQKLCAAFRKNYEGKLAGLSPEKFAKALDEYGHIQEILGRLGSYAQLLYAGDMSDPKISQFYQNIHEKLNDLYSYTLFFGLEINKLSERDVTKKLGSKALAKYKPWIRDCRAYSPYQLSDDVEKLLHDKSVSGHAAWNRLFDETIADLRFPIGKQQLTSAEALNLLSDPDGKKREQAAKIISEVFQKNIKTFALITNTIAKDKDIEDRWRGFKKPISSRNVSNYVEDAVVDALIATVHKNYPKLAHRYYAIKAKWLGKKQLEYWDRNAPLPQAADKSYSWDEAKELVLSSYVAFSPTLGKIGKKFFDGGWIDVPIRPGKAPGAFAHPTVPSVHPYLLLNFLGKTRDVMTLAHELGHGVHQVLSAKQGVLMADTPLTLAETASVFGEQLTFQEILRREKDQGKRKLIIASKVEDMLNTVVRQIAFCEFEMRVHAERKQGELSAERIGEIWMDVQGESLGPAIRLDKSYAPYWSYIPHFVHTPFYVYAYAFGDCLVNSLYGEYQKAGKSGQSQAFERKYIAMLEAGGTLRHKELLAPFGLDASKPTFWQQGIDVISGLIDQIEA